jgi:hypothetical protein
LRDLAGDLRYSEPDSLAATLMYQAADEIDDKAAGGEARFRAAIKAVLEERGP